MEPSSQILVVTLSETDKRSLKILAARQGRPMRDVVRGLIHQAVSTAGGDEREVADARS